MTFLEMCQTVRLLSGIQGTGPTSVVDAVGVEAVIVQFVKDANRDIQSARDDFDFMKASGSFTTVQGVRTYTLASLFTPLAPPLKTYDKLSFRLQNPDGHISVLPVAEYWEGFSRATENNTEQNVPGRLGISPDLTIALDVPADAAYSVGYSYWRNPQILTNNPDTSWIPVASHMLIVYKALEKMGLYLSQPEIYRNYNVETTRMLGQLMRVAIPKKRLVRRPIA